MEGEEAFIGVFRRYPVVFARGEGVRLYDEAGRAYWDFLAGIGVSSLGHNHPLLREALAGSLGLLHTSNFFWNRPAIRLAERLQRISGGMRVFFANSGTEANEAAIKIMRRFGRETDRHHILTLTGGFHGRTMGALAMTPIPAYQEPFRPLPDGFSAVPFGDLDALRAALHTLRPAGVMVEAIQGEAGVVVPPPGYLKALADLAREAGALVALDAVQTGMGRTGEWFGHEPEGFEPDVVTLAKGLGGGVPIGAALARPGVAERLQPGDHGTTFGGNPLAASAGLAVLDWLEGEGLKVVRRRGAILAEALGRLRSRHPERVLEVRGRGLMWGLALDRPSAPVVARALEEGLVVNATGGSVVRLLPPLVVDEEAIHAAVDILDRVLHDA